MNRALPVLLTILLVAGTFPALVATARTTSGGDGLMALAHPQDAQQEGGEVLVRPNAGSYVFDVEVVDDQGNPQDIETFAYGLYTPDEASRDPSDFDPNDPYWEQFTLVKVAGQDRDETDNEVRVEVPTSAIGFGAAAPVNGAAFFFTVRSTASESFDPSSVKTSHFNLVSNQQAGSGNWQDADASSEDSFTPLVLSTADTDDLVELNQPVLNPDFSVGSSAGTIALLDPGQQNMQGEATHAAAATPPWHLELHGSNEGFAEVKSTTEHSLAGDGGVLSIDVSDGDLDGSNEQLQLVQNIGELQRNPERTGRSLPLNWTSPDSVEVTLRASDYAHVSLGLTFLPDAGAEDHPTVYADFVLGGGGGWQTFTVNVTDNCFGDCSSIDERGIWQVYMGVLDADVTDNTPVTLDVSDLRVVGAVHTPVDLRSDLSDGYAVHIEPLTLTADADLPATKALETLAGDKYLFEVTIWDTVRDEKVAPSGYMSESMLRVGYFDPRGEHTTSHGDPYVAQSPVSFELAGDDAVVAAIDKAAVGERVTTSLWFWGNVGSDYVMDVVNVPADPAHGYYSIQKNGVEGWALADQLDLAATPLTFTNETGDEPFTFDASVSSLDPGSDTSGASVTVTSNSPVAEDLEVALNVNGTVETRVAQGVADGREVTVNFHSEIPENDTTLTVADGVFTRGLELAFGPPAVSVLGVSTLGGSLTDGVTATLEGTAVDMDLDPQIVSATWTISNGSKGIHEELVVDDPGAGLSVNLTFPDDGVYNVTLAATDDEGETDADTLAGVSVANAVPVFDGQELDVTSTTVVADDVNATWSVPVGLVDLASPASDPSFDGSLVGEVSVTSTSAVGVPDGDGGFVSEVYEDSKAFTGDGVRVGLPSPGTYSVTVTHTDDDGAVVATTGTLEAVDAEVTSAFSIWRPTVDGEWSGNGTALAGESAEAVVGLLFVGDRPAEDVELRLLDPSGNVVVNSTAPARTVSFNGGASLLSVYSLSSNLPVAGTYTLGFVGSSFLGENLSTVFSEGRVVLANSAPSVTVASQRGGSGGVVYVEEGETLELSAAGSDPDCVLDGPRCGTSLAWDLDGDGAVDEVGSSVEFTPEGVSDASDPVRVVNVTVTDHLGATTTESFRYVVDDRIELSGLDVAGAREVEGESGTVYHIESPFGDVRVQGRLVDDLGAAQAGTVAYDVVYSPHPGLADAGWAWRVLWMTLSRGR